MTSEYINSRERILLIETINLLHREISQNLTLYIISSRFYCDGFIVRELECSVTKIFFVKRLKML